MFEAIAPLAFGITVVGLWAAAAADLKNKAWWWYFRHVVAGTVAVSIGLIVLGLIYWGWVGAIVGLVISAAAAEAGYRAWRGNKRVAAEEKSKDSVSTEQSMPDAVRREIQALKRLGGARRTSYKGISAAAPKSRHADRIDVIRFDYLNQSGEFSTRRVMVQFVGEWQFEGVDLDKGAERTFRYDSVVGDIESEETGEVLSPLAWREVIR